MTQEQEPHTSTPLSALTVGQWQRAREDHFKVKVGGHRVCVVCGEHLTCILDKLETAEAENAALETALREIDGYMALYKPAPPPPASWWFDVRQIVKRALAARDGAEG